MAGSKTSRFDKRSAIKSLRFPRSVGNADRGNPVTGQIVGRIPKIKPACRRFCFLYCFIILILG